MQLCTCQEVHSGALKTAAWQLAVIHAAQSVPAEVCSTSVLHGLCSLCCGPDHAVHLQAGPFISNS